MGHFKFLKEVYLNNLKPGETLDESDLSLHLHGDRLVQFEHVEDVTDNNVVVQPGIWAIDIINHEAVLTKANFHEDKILEEFLHTQALAEKIDKFFSKLHVYKKYGIEVPKRAFLLFGPPGTGKTSSLIKVCKQYVKDEKTAIILWHSDKIDPRVVKSFIQRFDYSKVEKLILVIEDLGGADMENVSIPSQSSLLSILDNQEMIFKKPVLIISTTNHPENFLSNITNRPQRFDDKIRMDYPPPEYRSKLLKFFNPDVTEEQCKLIEDRKYSQFSPAHIKEIFIRSDLYDLSFEDCISQMYKEIEEYKKAFQQTNKLGL